MTRDDFKRASFKEVGPGGVNKLDKKGVRRRARRRLKQENP